MRIYDRFDYADYYRNAEKYKNYRTALVASHVFTENGTSDLRQGECVGIAYARTEFNGLYNRFEPVYAVTANGNQWGEMFASTLADFVL